MFIRKVLFKNRNDFHARMECEHCSARRELREGYNDDYYHLKVIPESRCHECRKSRNDLFADIDKNEDLLSTISATERLIAQINNLIDESFPFLPQEHIIHFKEQISRLEKEKITLEEELIKREEAVGNSICINCKRYCWPETYLINYDDGEKPLPGTTDLCTPCYKKIFDK